MNAIKAIVRNGRIETDGPLELPDGTELWIPMPNGTADDELTADEIVRTLTAMERFEPLDIPADVAADLDAWERQIERYGIDRESAGGTS